MNIFYTIGLIVAAVATLIVITLIAEHFRKRKELKKKEYDYEYFKKIFLDNEVAITNEYKQAIKLYKKTPDIKSLDVIYAIVNLLDINSGKCNPTIIKTSNISFTSSSIVINYVMDVSHHIFRGAKDETFTFNIPIREYNESWFIDKRIAAHYFLQSIKNNKKIEYGADLLS